MSILGGMTLGFLVWFFVRYGFLGIYTVKQNERAVKTIFGRAQRLPGSPDVAFPADGLTDDEQKRYRFPQVKVRGPGLGFKWPWETVHKATVATETISMAHDPESSTANSGGTVLETVTKDQLNTGLTGQIRYRVSETNLYPYLFGVKNPMAHVMGFFISILRQRIANFEAPKRVGFDGESEAGGFDLSEVSGVSINDLRKNLQDLNDHMLTECRSSRSRYGIVLDASLITGIDPPSEVESALAAINTAHNHVSAEISLAKAEADQRIVQSKRAVEIETLKAHAEVEPLTPLAAQLSALKNSGPQALRAYLRNIRLDLFSKAGRIFLENRS